MPNSKYTLLYISSLTLLILLLTACDKRTVYNHYEHTPLSGWERNDTLSFAVGPVGESGSYVEDLGLRISNEYPFMSLSLIVDQEVSSTHEKRRDTLACDLISGQGVVKGQGVSQYQYSFHLTTMELQSGDKLYVSVRHDMKREILPGISDVGLKLSRK